MWASKLIGEAGDAKNVIENYSDGYSITIEILVEQTVLSGAIVGACIKSEGMSAICL